MILAFCKMTIFIIKKFA